jgi:hypothetical protein
LRRLDECASLAVGEEFAETAAPGWALCHTVSACADVGDFARAAQWCRALHTWSAVWQARHFFGVCRTAYGEVLATAGDWKSAEQELVSAMEDLRITVADVPTCMPLDAHTVSCAAVRRIELDLGDGPDVAVIDTPHAVSLEGGNGPDRYIALASRRPSRVDFAGGIGRDVANYFYATAGIHVSVDLQAGDGRPGDDDRIHRDVEEVVGSEFADVLAGSPHTVRMAGNDGDDQITGGTGAELLSGGHGNDRIDARDGAPDTVDCGGQALDRAAVDIDAEASITGCAQVIS